MHSLAMNNSRFLLTPHPFTRLPPPPPPPQAMYADSDKIGTYRTGGNPLTYPDAVVMERPFKCTCLCIQRPVIHVKHNTLGYFATVRNPFAVCSREFTVGPPVDDGNMHGAVAAAVAGAPPGGWYRVHGTICQPAFWCSLPCGECSKLRFEIFHADDTAMAKPIGQLHRVFPGCLKSIATDADNYTIEYPVDATPLQKAALASTTVLLDFIMFGAWRGGSIDHCNAAFQRERGRGRLLGPSECRMGSVLTKARHPPRPPPPPSFCRGQRQQPAGRRGRRPHWRHPARGALDGSLRAAKPLAGSAAGRPVRASLRGQHHTRQQELLLL